MQLSSKTIVATRDTPALLHAALAAEARRYAQTEATNHGIGELPRNDEAHILQPCSGPFDADGETTLPLNHEARPDMSKGAWHPWGSASEFPSGTRSEFPAYPHRAAAPGPQRPQRALSLSRARGRLETSACHAPPAPSPTPPPPPAAETCRSLSHVPSPSDTVSEFPSCPHRAPAPQRALSLSRSLSLSRAPSVRAVVVCNHKLYTHQRDATGVRFASVVIDSAESSRDYAQEVAALLAADPLLTFPLFAKPSDGVGSVHTRRVDSVEEAAAHIRSIKSPHACSPTRRFLLAHAPAVASELEQAGCAVCLLEEWVDSEKVTTDGKEHPSAFHACKTPSAKPPHVQAELHAHFKSVVEQLRDRDGVDNCLVDVEQHVRYKP
ncbi:hypothetical protein T484DRAFT_1787035 [Baffinella frigidus]|nr:hypothetical protein T484DRAFT_1787035 [Cryptophyta sp. CCMP2293]